MYPSLHCFNRPNVRILATVAFLLASGCSGKVDLPQIACQPATQVCACQDRCPDGYQCEKGVCVSSTANERDLDVKTARVAGTLTLNGGSPAKACSAKDDIVAGVQLDELNLGTHTVLYARCQSADPMAPITFASTVFQGTYKVSVFGYARASSLLPLGEASAVVTNASLRIGGDMPSMDLDIKGYTVSGTLTQNGISPAKSCVTTGDEVARVILDDASSGHHVELIASCASVGDTAPVTFSGTVPGGVYKVAVRGSYGGGSSIPLLPLVGAQGLQSSLFIYSDTSALNLDVKTFQLGGEVTLNGISPSMMCPPAGAEGSIATLLLDETTTGNHLELSVKCNPSGNLIFDGKVYPGIYKLSIIGRSQNSISAFLPVTAPQVVEPSLTVNADIASRRLDVSAHKVSGSVTLNGGPPQKSCESKGQSVGKVLFDEANAKTHIEVAATCAETGATAAVRYSGYLYAGTYTVSLAGYAPEPSTTLLPMPGAVQVRSALDVHGEVTDLRLDAKTFSVAGTVTRNDGPAQKRCANLPGGAIAKVLFDETTTNSHIELIAVCEGIKANSNVTFGGQVYPGTYRVSVAGVVLGDGAITGLPTPGAGVVRPSLIVKADMPALTLNAQTVTFSGTVKHNGGPGGAACAKKGDIGAKVLLDELTLGSHIELTATCDDIGMAHLRFRDAVYPGTYKLSVVGYDSAHTTNIPELPPMPIIPRLHID